MTKSLHLSILILMVLALLGTGAWAAKPAPKPIPPPHLSTEPRYFYNIDLNPQYQVVGTGALTEETASRANCYRFSYDQDGKVKQIDYRRAGTPMQDPFFGVSCIIFEYQPGIERRWYRDAQGQPANNVAGIAGEELTLNPAGYPTDIANLNASGAHMRDSSGVIHYVRTLDDINRVVAARRIGLLGTTITDNDGFFETRTVYDDQGRPMERGNYDSSGQLLNNNDGVAFIRTSYTIFPDSTQSIESYFDASGLAAVEKSSGVHALQRTTDNRGQRLSASYFDVTGAPSLDSQMKIHERRYAYDALGNKISESFYDTDGRPKNLLDVGFAKVDYKYDDKNRVVETDFFGDDGTPQIVPNLGYAILRQEYDGKGNIVHQQFFDGKKNPTASAKYNAPAIRVRVEGDTTIVTLRDANDKPMKNPVAGYAVFSYKTATDKPLSPFNHYYNLRSRTLSYFPRIQVINPHLHAMRSDHVMEASARLGAAAAGLGALLACFLALRKASHTKRRKVYVPLPIERFLGWFSVFAILEGTLRFFMTVYWAEVGYLNGKMGPGVYVLETLFIVFFLYRLLRLSVTMRVLNIDREDIHRLVRDFFAKAKLNPEWIPERKMYVTPAFGVRVRHFKQKYHAYLAFERLQYYSPITAVFLLVMILWMVCFGRAGWQLMVPLALALSWGYVRLTRPNMTLYHEGRDLARGLDRYIRAHVRDILALPRTRMIAFYYPSVALCYFLLSCTGFYTLWQLLKGF